MIVLKNLPLHRHPHHRKVLICTSHLGCILGTLCRLYLPQSRSPCGATPTPEASASSPVCFTISAVWTLGSTLPYFPPAVGGAKLQTTPDKSPPPTNICFVILDRLTFFLTLLRKNCRLSPRSLQRPHIAARRVSCHDTTFPIALTTCASQVSFAPIMPANALTEEARERETFR